MRLRGKLFVTLALALTLILTVQVGTGFALLSAVGTEHRWALLVVLSGQSAVAIAAVIWVALVIVRSVSRGLEHALTVATTLAEGHTTDLPDDELRRLAVLLDASAERVAADRAEALDQQRALLKAQREAASADDTKRAFLANITHEVRTPLNGLLGSLGLLDHTSLTAEQRELATAARDSAHRLSGLVEQVLDLTEASDGSLHLEPIELDVVDLFSDVVSRARTDAPDHRFTFAVAPGGPRMAIADAGRLRQVLAELLKNATRATEGGHVSVAVTTTTEGRQLRVRVDVDDDGPGIPEELKASIFEPFTQVDNSYTRPHEGPGLGLALCQRILERMGGTLGVERRPGGGSRFYFRICLDDPDASAATCAIDDSSPSAGGSIRVLVHEPEAATATRLVGMLRDHGESAHVHADPATLTTEIGSRAYDLALVRVDDVHAAPDLVQRLRASCDARNQLTALVAVTAASPNTRLVLLEQGWDDAVSAPLTRRATAEVIAAWLVSRPDRLAG